MRPQKVVGVDIGGANLKYCSADRSALSEAFAIWRQPDQLAAALVRGLGKYTDPHAIAVTLTGELADCFVDRDVGVKHIVDHTINAASDLGIEQVAFYGVDGTFKAAATAKQQVDIVASANWHALASYVARDVTAEAILIDVGSTTTDIISLAGGRIATTARTDHERLVEGSLVYVGCRRTPVCAIVDSLEFQGRICPVMNEFFATIDDARVLLGNEPEDRHDCDSADGQPRTRDYAANRIARMIGLDGRSVSIDDAIPLARQVVEAAKRMIGHSIPDFGDFVVCGHGDDLLSLPASGSIVKMADQFGADASRCAPSYAVAMLYQASSTQAHG